MVTIIQQIALNLAKEITEKALSGGISDLDGFAADALDDCKHAAIEIIEVILQQMNDEIRSDKQGRKELGLVTKEKDRPRELLTELGPVKYKRDYYWSKSNCAYVSLLDSIIGVRAYERIGDSVSARLVSLASDMSYARSSAVATGGNVSRQTVRNHILKLEVPESPPMEENRKVRELHVFADEDHVHMQKKGKQRGKKNRIVPLVTVTEGVEHVCAHRNRTVNAKHFVDENFSTGNLWKSVEGYISKVYDTSMIEKIYVHGDGGKWIGSGLDSFVQTEHVMDGYHLGKRLRAFTRRFGKSARQRMDHAIRTDNRRYADNALQELLEEYRDSEAYTELKEFAVYLMGNWDEIVKRKTEAMTGSCTEGQVSHVLSERFSRNPMGWSDEALGKLTGIRVFIKNGEQLTAEHFKPHISKEKYADYADTVIDVCLGGAIDWSLFDVERTAFDIASGPQVKIHGLGKMRNTLFQ